MNIKSIKRWFLGVAFTLATVITMPAQAWPDVDTMNMCGAAVKPVHAGWQGWGQHDRYVAKRGSAYYYRSNCPSTVASKAPAKKYKKATAVKVKSMSANASTVDKAEEKSTAQAIKEAIAYAKAKKEAKAKLAAAAGKDATAKADDKKSTTAEEATKTPVAKKASSKKSAKKKSSYNENYDCARVDLVNGFSPAQVRKMHGAAALRNAR